MEVLLFLFFLVIFTPIMLLMAPFIIMASVKAQKKAQLEKDMQELMKINPEYYMELRKKELDQRMTALQKGGESNVNNEALKAGIGIGFRLIQAFMQQKK
jgi:hypothetical protein